MNQRIAQTAAIPNAALTPLSVLIGNWETTGTHPMFPGTTLRGRASFEWIENGAFLMWRTEIDSPGFPSGISIIGSDDSVEEYFMLYFDERGVSRRFEVSLHDNAWKMWRNAPGFSQRMTGTIVDGGKSMVIASELSRDDRTWQKDLEQTYTRTG